MRMRPALGRDGRSTSISGSAQASDRSSRAASCAPAPREAQPLARTSSRCETGKSTARAPDATAAVREVTLPAPATAARRARRAATRPRRAGDRQPRSIRAATLRTRPSSGAIYAAVGIVTGRHGARRTDQTT